MLSTITKNTVDDGVRRAFSEAAHRAGAVNDRSRAPTPCSRRLGLCLVATHAAPDSSTALVVRQGAAQAQKSVEPCLAASRRGSFVVCCENGETASPSAPDLDSSARGSFVVGCVTTKTAAATK